MVARKRKITKLTLAFATACLLTMLSTAPKPVFSQNTEQLYQQGIATYNRGYFLEAESIFRQVIEISSNHSGAYNALGASLYEQEKIEDAIANYKKAIQLDLNYAEAYNNLGVALRKQRKLESAITNYRQAIELDPDFAGAYSNLGNALRQQGKLEEAIKNHQQAIELNPNDAGYYENLGLSQLDNGQLEEAVLNFQRAIKLNPNDFAFYDGLGSAQYYQGKLEESVLNFQKAIELNPNDARIHNNLGSVLEEQGKLEEAIQQYQSSLRVDPNYIKARNNLKETERQLAIKLDPPLPDIDDTKFLPSSTEEILVNTLRSTTRIIAQVSAEGTSIGAGWVFKQEANTVWIVTNRHVISDSTTDILSKKIEVEFFSELPAKDRPRYIATIINSTNADDELDLAVLTVTGIPEDIQKLEMRSGRVARDTNVRIIGHPFTVDNPWSVSRGQIMNSNPNSPLISVSGFFAQGNSGGPVIDSNNQVIGMMVEIRANVDFAFDPNQTTLNIDEVQPATGGVGLAYRIDIVIEQLREWGIVD